MAKCNLVERAGLASERHDLRIPIGDVQVASAVRRSEAAIMIGAENIWKSAQQRCHGPRTEARCVARPRAIVRAEGLVRLEYC